MTTKKTKYHKTKETRNRELIDRRAGLFISFVFTNPLSSLSRLSGPPSSGNLGVFKYREWAQKKPWYKFKNPFFKVSAICTHFGGSFGFKTHWFPGGLAKMSFLDRRLISCEQDVEPPNLSWASVFTSSTWPTTTLLLFTSL